MWTLSPSSPPSDDEINIDIIYIDYGPSPSHHPTGSASLPDPAPDRQLHTGLPANDSVCSDHCMGIPNQD